MFELLRKPLSNREWVLLGLLQGIAGGVVGLVIDIAWSVIQGDLIGALSAPLFLPCVALAGLVNAFLAIPVYRWLVRQVALADQSKRAKEGGNAA
jgi:hypothetical protein